MSTTHIDAQAALGCHCPSCMAGITQHSLATQPASTDASLDPDAGGTYRDKPIWDLTTIEANLNRTNQDWYTNNYGELDDGVLNFGFWKNIEELNNSYYVNETGTIAFNEAYYAADFSAFNSQQIAGAENAIGLWGDLISGIQFNETKSGNADITYGNTFTGGAQAYAYLPFGDVNDQYYHDLYGFDEAGRLGGDVWIDGFVASNFSPIENSYYAITTLIHETGHSLGLSHPGDYNATDDNDGDGVPDPITYEGDASYAQDSLQYSIMSYFDGYETGAQFIDFNLLNFAYPSTPMIHDIATIQNMYGTDYTTRADDTTYGFHSTETGTAYDFKANDRPVLSIWDGGGNDTLDVSGFKTDSYVNLNAGAFSSAGGADHFATLDEVNANRAALGFAARTQATYDYYQDLIAQLGITSPQFKDNISIAYGATIENAVGGGGNDTIVANEVANVINGRNGSDTVSYETSATAVDITLRGSAAAGAGSEANPNGAAGDQLISIESAIGSRFDDHIVGNARDNTINGGQGDDSLKGGKGADTFAFGTLISAGHDTILDFSNEDLVAVRNKIPGTAAGDGVIHTDDNGVLVIDKSDGDSITFRGYDADDGLKLVGQANGYFYYAAADSTATQASVDKLTAPAQTIEEIDAATKAQIAAANGPDQASIDLGQRAEGYAGSATSHYGEDNTAHTGTVTEAVFVNPDTGSMTDGREGFTGQFHHSAAPALDLTAMHIAALV